MPLRILSDDQMILLEVYCLQWSDAPNEQNGAQNGKGIKFETVIKIIAGKIVNNVFGFYLVCAQT